MNKYFVIFMTTMMLGFTGCQQSTDDQKTQQTEEQNKAGMRQNPTQNMKQNNIERPSNQTNGTQKKQNYNQKSNANKNNENQDW